MGSRTQHEALAWFGRVLFFLDILDVMYGEKLFVVIDLIYVWS